MTGMVRGLVALIILGLGLFGIANAEVRLPILLALCVVSIAAIFPNDL